MIKQLAHLCFFTNQLDRMIVFYRDVLGCPVKFTMCNNDGFEFGHYFALGERTFIEIFDQAGAIKQWGGDKVPRRPSGSDERYRHFSFEVSGIEGFCARLRAKGVEVTPVKTEMDHSKQAWLKDPDGNAIELMEYTPRSLQLVGGKVP